MGFRPFWSYLWYLLLKCTHCILDNYELGIKTFSNFSILLELLKASLLYHQRLLSQATTKKGNHTSRVLYNSQDDSSIFFPASLITFSARVFFYVEYTILLSSQRNFLFQINDTALHQTSPNLTATELPVNKKGAK